MDDTSRKPHLYGLIIALPPSLALWAAILVFVLD